MQEAGKPKQLSQVADKTKEPRIRMGLVVHEDGGVHHGNI